MVQQVEEYIVVCDNCGRTYKRTTFSLGERIERERFSGREVAEATFRENPQSWVIAEGKYGEVCLCPACKDKCNAKEL